MLPPPDSGNLAARRGTVQPPMGLPAYVLGAVTRGSEKNPAGCGASSEGTPEREGDDRSGRWSVPDENPHQPSALGMRAAYFGARRARPHASSMVVRNIARQQDE